MKFLTVENWSDYELIDTGGGEKLERFGKYVTSRPEPQAIWQKSLQMQQWLNQADAVFTRESGKNDDTGKWTLKPNMPEQWFVRYKYKKLDFSMRLGLTAFKHVGVFPEQAANWNFIYDAIAEMPVSQPKVLNLFAYTGGASLAAKSAGADVTHVDSIRNVVTWASDNQDASKLSGIRWVVEDAMKFAQREVNRKNKYNGIILDPPAFGRGPKGEIWKLEDNIDRLLMLCAELLTEENNFLILNVYSKGLSALIIENLTKFYFPLVKHYDIGELYIPDKRNFKLPLGIFVRFSNKKS